MRILGVDAPRGWAVLDVPRGGDAVALSCGNLDAGRETDELADMIAKWSPARFVIETPLEPYVHGRAAHGGPGATRAIMISLIATSRLAGRLEERARMSGLVAVVTDADHVRRALSIGGRDESERDRNVKSFLRQRVSNWPRQSNVDERDAAAACIYAAGLLI
jgi:hypothetical protein